MLPLSLANIGEDNSIKMICGSPDVKKHLEDMGFIQGCTVKVISVLSGNVIVRIKGSRIAVSEEMAKRIMV